jgi:hypothetical protein
MQGMDLARHYKNRGHSSCEAFLKSFGTTIIIAAIAVVVVDLCN